jgi:hypothetical protein
MMTSRSLICLLENQNGGKLQKVYYYTGFIRRLIVTRVGWDTTNAVRSAPTERVSQCVL